MNIFKIAILLTVFNRKEITLQGLRSLSKAINYLGEGYDFDIYMTDDGCTDGTRDAVAKEFPKVVIVQGDGNLYWSGGMRKAWKAAIDSMIDYDGYLWFNDDVFLYDDALKTLFDAAYSEKPESIISGAFCDVNGNVSYGGSDSNGIYREPNGQLQKITLMNGNLVFINRTIYSKLGNIDKVYTHSLGDWDYGIRAIEQGFQLFITPKYVGVCNRHDSLRKCFDSKFKLCVRLKSLYSATSIRPFEFFYFEKRRTGMLKAIKSFIAVHYFCFFPSKYRYKQ